MSEVKSLPALVWYWSMGWRTGIVLARRQARKSGAVTYRVLATATPSISWLPAAAIAERPVVRHAQPYPMSRALRHCRAMVRDYKSAGQAAPSSYRKALVELRAGGV